MRLKTFFLLLISLLLYSNCNGQSIKQLIKDRITHGFGFEIDYSIYPFIVLNSSAEGINYWESIGLQLPYFIRFNTLELNDNNTISITVSPSLGLNYHRNSSNTEGFGSLNLSSEINYIWGLGATSRTKETVGFIVGLSRETRFFPLFFNTKKPKAPYVNKEIFKGLGAKCGMTFSKKKNFEVYGKVIYFPKQGPHLDGNIDLIYIPQYTILAGVLFYFNTKK